MTPPAATVIMLTRRAEDAVQRVLDRVPADAWDAPSACAAWSVRDVAGHLCWGRVLVTRTALGEAFTDRSGAPGSEHPGAFAGDDPASTFAGLRAETDRVYTPENLARPAPPVILARNPNATLGDFSMNMVRDMIVHAWDIAHPLGLDHEIGDDLVAAARDGLGEPLRSPVMFGPEASAPADADQLTAFAAFLGRSVN